ncbi:immunoglobulin lambda-1 light chain-like [Brachyhypopomus gauderio]|uniref:immunoglobulin lambda-1 light chain-like n=1 Tax=Brachyhypopomus gauderio TaxID=698409 RepID=UPI0040417C94
MNLTMFEVTAMYFVFVFIGCINAQFTQKSWEVARSERIKVLSCDVDGSTSLSQTAVHWYRAKPGEELQRILHFPSGTTTATREASFGRGFSGSIKGQKVSLTISKVKREDEATYFCALWKGDTAVFSSGIRLYVADGVNQIKVPKVSTYLATEQDNGKSILLCQAREMFPDILKITWEAKDKKEAVLTVPETDDELLEQRDEGQFRVTSLLIINHQKETTNKYSCSVQHDNKHQKLTVQRGEEKPDVTPIPSLVQTCSLPNVQQGVREEVDSQEETRQDIRGRSRSLNLFRLTYVVLVVKNLLYFCCVSVLLYKRNAWNKESNPPE